MKLLAADFDNTFLNDGDYYKNVEYANKFIDAGNIFVIITGRFENSLLRVIKNTGLKFNYIICNDGGIIFDNKHNIIYQMDIPKNIVYDIATMYEESECLNYWYIDTGTSITNNKNSNANGLIGHFSNRKDAEKLLTSIKNKYKEIDGYLSHRWINITEKSVNKGSGLKKLIDYINIKDENVYTIGDNINDISMSNYRFNDFRMTNSAIELKESTKKAYDAVYKLIIDILKKD